MHKITLFYSREGRKRKHRVGTSENKPGRLSVMPLAPEEAFHNCLQQCRDGVIRECMFVRTYRGRKDLADVEPENLRSLLTTIKTTMNVGLVSRKRVPEHFDDLPFHFDYIESDFPNALAFRDESYAFIGITIPLIMEMLETSTDLSRSVRIRQILDLDEGIEDRLQAVLFQNLLTLIVTHEFTHHVHGHVIREKGTSTFYSEFDSNDGNGSMQKQADADGYAVYHVLSNEINSPARDNTVTALNLREKSTEVIDQTLFLCFVVVACAHLSSHKLIDIERVDILTQSHPPQAARLDYLMRHAVLWCEPNKPLLVNWITQERFRRVMEVVADEMWGIESHRPWAAQTAFLSSDKGKEYLQELTKGKRMGLGPNSPLVDAAPRAFQLHCALKYSSFARSA
jgi:hypothetical protein